MVVHSNGRRVAILTKALYNFKQLINKLEHEMLLLPSRDVTYVP
jgi:hypothetical protein